MKKILLLTDFSEASQNALAFARSFFSDTVADFHLLYAHPVEPNEGNNAKPVTETTRAAYVDQLQAIVTGLRREATNDWHTFRSSDRLWYPREVVGQAAKAEAYDFVVIGPQQNDTDGLFGNSAIALVRQLKLNVLVVPIDADAQRPIRQVVLAADFANLKNSKLLSPLKELVTLKGATLTLLTIDTPGKDIVHVEQEAHIRRFLNPIEPLVTRLVASNAKQGIDAYLTENLADLLVTIPKSQTDTLTSSRVTRQPAFAPLVPLLTLYDDGSDDLPQPINDLSTIEYAH